ncbi:MAG TPA: hypothetical protein ENN81_12430 [Phycisphaerales bacterium]|nr:hypothetical protein [Phycisphaerales bacterium]
MSEEDREIHELLVDYADGLRDGCLPNFLKSLTRAEARAMADSPEFREATEMVRILNEVGFSDRMESPNVGLFISRVDACIGSRMKKGEASTRRNRGSEPRSRIDVRGKTEEKI